MKNTSKIMNSKTAKGRNASQSASLGNPVNPTFHRASYRRLALATAVACLGSMGTALAATYQFLPVASTGTYTSTFTSLNGNGVIKVTDSFSVGGAGLDENNNAAIYPSQFTTLFPGTGLVQGHLLQTVYAQTSVMTIDLTGYALSSTTVFGMWNTSDEVTAVVGGPPVYQIQLLDASNNLVSPTTFNLIGNQDNQTQVAGRSQMVMNPLTGEITAGTVINPGGVHTNAAFWDNIPAGTKQIILYANLPPLNPFGDGVGLYFAEVIPEPTTYVLSALGLVFAGMVRRRPRS